MQREQFKFFHTLRVRWAEVDMQAVVFNGNYLNYFDVAYTEYWRVLGLPNVVAQSASGNEMFARKVSVEYNGSARFDELIDIGVRCVAIGRSSIRFEIGIFRDNEHLIAGELTYVRANTALRKAVAIAQEWRDVIAAFELIKPEGV